MGQATKVEGLLQRRRSVPPLMAVKRRGRRIVGKGREPARVKCLKPAFAVSEEARAGIVMVPRGVVPGVIGVPVEFSDKGMETVVGDLL